MNEVVVFAKYLEAYNLLKKEDQKRVDQLAESINRHGHRGYESILDAISNLLFPPPPLTPEQKEGEETFEEYIKGRKCKEFKPTPMYFPNGDYILYFKSDQRCVARRIDELLTVYETDKMIIGVKIKGVMHYFNQLVISRILPGTLVYIVPLAGLLRLRRMFSMDTVNEVFYDEAIELVGKEEVRV